MSLAALRQPLGDRLIAIEEFRGQPMAEVAPDSVLQACQLLKDQGFNLLAALTASDRWPAEPRFSVVYHLYSVPENRFVGLRARVPGQAAELPSVEPAYPNANWHEREVFDMFGIRFDGNTDLRRILMPYDWEGHPLRKDYPLGYEEVQFTFNFDDIDKRKRYAKQ